ncbi:FAD-dependent monooxygenase [Streptomyces sp. NPDC048606]|uniref:FAD-dependent monooxygenase n=1 Tax=Streptomyces sp. NPDC048606 TaxID=3154726 RepID=UPI0034345A6A
MPTLEGTTPPRPRAIVIGGSTTGMLAASVLADFADVTVVERDVLPEGPDARKGLPQARHGHLLWSGGVRAYEELLPGIVDELVALGARRTPVMTDLVSKAPSGQWFRRWQGARHVNLVCSRDLFDSAVRREVLRRPGVGLRRQTELLALEGDATLVTGVRVRSADGEESLSADLVIDASGRGSHAPTWLRDLGLPPVPERVVDAGVGYASRVYRAPGTTAEGFPLVNVQADPRSAPGRGGIILPVEGGRWLVTLSGTRGGRPTRRNEDFLDFARSLSDPVIAELLSGATPLTDVVTTRTTANRRRFYEKARRWPSGFAVLGDAVAGFNPVYGHGLTVTAQSALALRAVLAAHDLRAPGTARRIQRAAAGPVGIAWALAVGQDVFYPGAGEKGPTAVERFLASFIDRAVDAGARNPHAMAALLDVMSMEKPPTRLFRPDMLRHMFSGPKKPLLSGPPLSEAERAAARAQVPEPLPTGAEAGS